MVASIVAPFSTLVKFTPDTSALSACTSKAVPLASSTSTPVMVAVPFSDLTLTALSPVLLFTVTVSSFTLPLLDVTSIAVLVVPFTFTPDTTTLFSAIALIPLLALFIVLFPVISTFCASTSIAVPSMLSALMFSMFTVPLDAMLIPLPSTMSLIAMLDSVMLSAWLVIADPPLTPVKLTPLISTLSPAILKIPLFPLASIVLPLPCIVLFSGISTIWSPSWNT